MNKVCVLSLGCAKNLTDSEVMLAALQKSGYEITCDEQEAEVMVVNTCCFIESAKQESIDTILELADYKKQGKLKLLIVAGCMGERYKEEVLEELPEVDAVCGTGDFGEIVEVIEKAQEKRGVYRKGAERAPLDTKDRVLATPPYTAYLKIAEGCDNHCTYCVIPKIRGKYRSREVSSILEEARQLAQKGVKELVVIAQDTSCYGKDLEDRPTLAQLLDQLGTIDGIVWIRVHYLYPEGVDEELLEEFQRNPKLVPYFDIPIQHVSDRILKRMARKTSKEEIVRLVENIRAKLPESAIRTSLIAGFPGETEEEFYELLEFLKAYELDRVGVFPYSQEEGTPAAEFEGQVEEEVKTARQMRAMELQYDVTEKRNRRQIGKTLQILTEGYDKLLKLYYGRSYADSIDVDPKVFFRSKKPVAAGEFVSVLIEESLDYDLIGTAIFES